MVIEKIIFKIHFCFLYVLMYSVVRNLNWMVDLSDRSAVVIRWLAIGFFIWFLGVNAFLYSRGSKVKWDRADYLSVWVVLVTIAIIAFLEYSVYY
jgi:hypothetical protein